MNFINLSVKGDDLVKSPDAALCGELVEPIRAGCLPFVVSLSNHARLAGACPGEIRGTFLQGRPGNWQFYGFLRFYQR